MEETRLTLHKNLKLMYYANGLSAICLVLVFIPVVTLIMAVIAVVMNLVGLVRLRNIHRRYMDAISFAAIGFLIGIIPAGDGMFGVCLGLIGSILGLIQFRCVIQATNHFLAEEGQEELVAKGEKVWRYQVVLTIVSMACAPLELVLAEHMILLLVVLAASLVFSVVALGVYIDYLEKSCKVFE